MKKGRRFIRNFRFYLIAGVLNLGSIIAIGYMNSSTPVSSSRPMVAAAANTKAATEAKEIIAGKPVHLSIPSLGLEFPIQEGHYNPDDGSWTLTDYGTHFAMPTMLANNHGGNTLVYGHNNRFVFGPLKDLKPGQAAEIRTDNGHIFYYTFQHSSSVAPEDVTVFEYEGPPMLTLQTCTGNWNELRRMSYFTLTNVTKFNPNALRDKANTEKLKAALSALTEPGYSQRAPLFVD